jgi:hypothetical protein
MDTGMDFHLDQDEGVWGWIELFLTLSLRSTEQFLPALGLTDARPGPLRETAHRILEDLWEVTQLRNDLEPADTVAESERILSAGFVEIERRFGRQIGKEVYECGTRHLDLDPLQTLMWHVLLYRLVFGAARGLASVPFPISGVKGMMVQDAIRRNIFDDPENRLDEDELQKFSEDVAYIRRFPLPVEGGIAMDVTSSLDNVIVQRGLMRALIEIGETLDQSDLDELLTWARKQAALVGLSADDLEVPGLMRRL